VVAQQRVRLARRRPALAAACIAALAAAGCDREDPAPASSEPAVSAVPVEPPPTRRDHDVFVYDCGDGARFTVLIDEDAALLLLPDSARRLQQEPAASGARYASGDDVFWSKGAEALLVVDGHEHAGCVSDTVAGVWEGARIRGVDYRAVGNEPGWHLEIVEGGQTVFVGDYGSTRLEFATPAPRRDEDAGSLHFAWRDGAERFEATLVTARCQDTMADLSYALTVTVEWNDRRLDGCGQALAVEAAPKVTSN
jgi:putative lipoprotein